MRNSLHKKSGGRIFRNRSDLAILICCISRLQLLNVAVSMELLTNSIFVVYFKVFPNKEKGDSGLLYFAPFSHHACKVIALLKLVFCQELFQRLAMQPMGLLLFQEWQEAHLEAAQTPVPVPCPTAAEGEPPQWCPTPGNLSRTGTGLFNLTSLKTTVKYKCILCLI